MNRTTIWIWLALIVCIPARGAVVRLQASATVARPIVVLGDVAEIASNDPADQKQLADIHLFPSPEPGQKRWFDLSDIKDVLYRRGIRLDEVEFAGVRRVEIARAEGDDEATASGQRSTEQWSKEIVKIVRSSLPESTREAGISVRIEGRKALEFLTVHQPQFWEILAPAAWHDGWQPAELEVPLEDEPARFPLQIQIARNIDVVAPRHVISRGEPIRQDDLTLVSYESDGRPTEVIDNLAAVVGKEAKNDLTPGQPIQTYDLKSIPVVFRNQPVTVTIRYGTAWLQKTFVAATDGGVGEWIDVYDPETRSRKPLDYQVRVVGPHTAEMPMTAPPSEAASRSRRAGAASNNR